MYKYAATDSIFDGVSDIYLISIATAFLAVIVAFYCSNFFKDENEPHLKDALNEVGYDNEENYLSDTTTETENHQLTRVPQDHLTSNELKVRSDSGDIKHIRHNSSFTHENSDNEEVHIDGLVSKLKSKRVKDLEAQLTRDQLEQEKRIEREQLAAIFELLKKQEAELNMKEIDETELNAQLALYR